MICKGHSNAVTGEPGTGLHDFSLATPGRLSVVTANGFTAQDPYSLTRE